MHEGDEDRGIDGSNADGSSRLTKDDWLQLAIQTLVREGIDQVKIQVMARTLGVSRSSFYWFFDSIQDLQDQLLDYWLKSNTARSSSAPFVPPPRLTGPSATFSNAGSITHCSSRISTWRFGLGGGLTRVSGLSFAKLTHRGSMH